MARWQVTQMWLGGLVTHLAAEALWARMHINEIGCCHTPTVITKSGVAQHNASEHSCFDKFIRCIADLMF